MRLARRLDSSIPRGRGVKSALLAAAVLFLLGGVVYSLRHHPEVLTGLDWRPALMVLLVAVPATVVGNGHMATGPGPPGRPTCNFPRPEPASAAPGKLHG